MTTWSDGHQKLVEIPDELVDFVDEYEDLCRKHGLMILLEGESLILDGREPCLGGLRNKVARDVARGLAPKPMRASTPGYYGIDHGGNGKFHRFWWWGADPMVALADLRPGMSVAGRLENFPGGATHCHHGAIPFEGWLKNPDHRYHLVTRRSEGRVVESAWTLARSKSGALKLDEDRTGNVPATRAVEDVVDEWPGDVWVMEGGAAVHLTEPPTKENHSLRSKE